MLQAQTARAVGPARIDIVYERHGSPADPPLLLVMGLGAQLLNWPDGLVDALVSRGLQVIRFDNRDAGRSTYLDVPAPDFAAVLAGDFSTVPYTLSDMAADTVGLLDALGIGAAHVAGASMGGAIAQVMAIEHRERVLSLTSIMSTTGDPAVGQMHEETRNAVFGGPPATTREAAIERALRTAPLTRSPAFPTSPEEIARRVGKAWDRSPNHDVAGWIRQGAATVAAGDRTAKLHTLDVPALVIHGTADTVCDASGGRATAAAIAGAEFVEIEGMAHDLPQGLWERLADHVAKLIRDAQAR